jgi:hypothetical protein
MLIAAFASFAILVAVWLFIPSGGTPHCDDCLD